VAHDELTSRGSLSPLVGVGESRSLESMLDVSGSSGTVEGSGDEFSRILQQAVSVCVCVCLCAHVCMCVCRYVNVCCMHVQGI